jgi:hypothetical protein
MAELLSEWAVTFIVALLFVCVMNIIVEEFSGP